MIKAIIKRKMWEVISQQLYIFWAVFIVYSTLDAFLTFPWEFWMFAGVAFIVIAPAHSFWAFGNDLHRENFRFLEYLPIRPSSLWFSYYVSGLIGVTICFLMLVWHKLIWFTYPEGVMAAVAFIPSRWALLLGGWAFCFFLYSLCINFVPCYDKQPPIVAIALLLPIIMFVYFANGASGYFLFPRPLDVAPVLLISGALFSFAGYIQFTKMPRHYPQKGMFLLLIALPLFVFVGLLSAGLFYRGLHRWTAIEKGELLLNQGATLVTAKNGAPFIYASIYSYRSGVHSVIINPETGTWRDWGRGYSLLRITQKYSPNPRLYFSSVIPSGSLVSRENNLACADLDDEKPRRIMTLPPNYDTYSLTASSDNTRLIIPERHEGKSNLLIADADGNILKTYPCRNNWPNHIIADDKAITIVPNVIVRSESGVSREQPAENPYLLIDIKTDETFRFDLPGAPLSFSRNLNAAVCLRLRIDGERFAQSILFIEIPSMKQRVLLSEEELPSLPISGQLNESENYSLFVKDYFEPSGFFERDTFLVFSKAFDKALWVKKQVVHERFLHSLVLVDLFTSEKRTVVHETEIPQTPVVSTESRRVPPVTVFGFTSDGEAIIYRVGSKLLCREWATSRTTALIERIEPEKFSSSPYYYMSFSPSRRRVLQYMPNESYFPKSIKKPKSNSILFVLEKGVPKLIWSSPESLISAWWLDETRIVIEVELGIYLIHADGTNLRKLL